MTDLNLFKRELDFWINEKVEKTSLAAVKRVVEVVYQQITTPGVWPVDTWWSIANHRISTSGEPIETLRPAERPKKSGALEGLAGRVREQELAKIRKLKKTPRNTIVIGNAVPYAADVGGKGNGVAIYADAVRAAEQIVEAEVESQQGLIV